MRELNQVEIEEVDGARASDIPMVIAGAWASTVAGAAVGSVVPGVGTIAGGAAGFVLGVAIGVGYSLSQK